MKATFRKALTGVGILALAGGALVATGGTALATNAPYFPDPGATLGGINFYDSTGALITSGSTSTSPFIGTGGFAVAQDGVAGGIKASYYAYTPVNGSPSGSWAGAQLSGATNYPISSPTDLASLPNPIVTGGSGDVSLDSYIATAPNTDTTADGYAGLYEIREKVTGHAGYAAADILVNATAHTWTQVDGGFTQTPDATSTALAAAPTSPASLPATVTLTATVTDTTDGVTPIGTVTFYDNLVQVGTAQAVSATGTASLVVTSPSIGTHPYSAVFTPANTAGFATSTGNLSYVVNDLDTTSIGLAESATHGQPNAPVTLTATVADTTNISATPTGTVSFLDGATPIGSAPVGAGGVATLSGYTGFVTVGGHNLTASYTPTSGSVFKPVTSTPAVVYTVDAASCPGQTGTACIDPQTVEATVLAGVITITTPYSGVDQAHTLNLGNLALNSSGTLLTASAPFGSTANAPASEIFVTDTQQGNANWTASVQAGQFTSTATPATPIDGQFAGLTNVAVQAVSSNQLTSSNVTVFQNPAGTSAPANGTNGIGGGKHAFATTTAGGDGSVGFTGTFTLNAPTSTTAGLYTGVVTFTVG